MKKTIKLTEADILKMVKRILEEQVSFSSPNGFLKGDNINKQGSVGQRRFDKVVAADELKKAGYKVYPDYVGLHALKFTLGFPPSSRFVPKPMLREALLLLLPFVKG